MWTVIDPQPKSSRAKVDRSRSLSSGWVTKTSWAGAVAVGTFSKWMVYGKVWSGRTKCMLPNPAGPTRSLGSVALTLPVLPAGPGLVGGLGWLGDVGWSQGGVAFPGPAPPP